MKMNPATFHDSMHLDSDMLEPPDLTCPFCGSTDRKPVCVLQNAPEVILLRCAECHADSASRMPTERALADYYGAYYNSSILSKRDDKITFASATRFAKHLATQFVQYQRDSHLSILDFGGGDGSIAHSVGVELLKTCHRVDITVVDYNEHMIVPKDKRISICREDTLAEISSDYDVVIASAIIEHLPKPRGMLNALLDRLKPGGVFYARTPYIVPLMTLLSPIGIKLDLTYPAHVHDLGQEFWESYFARVASPNSFQILQSKPSIVATNFREHFVTTLAAYLLKAPWYLIGRSYKLVGGWEVLALVQFGSSLT